MKRRALLKWVAGAPLFAPLLAWLPEAAQAAATPPSKVFRRVRPGEAGWPSAAQWDGLNRQVGGRLIKLADPRAAPILPARRAAISSLRSGIPFTSTTIRN